MNHSCLIKILIVVCVSTSLTAFSQGSISGSLESNLNVFLRDSVIGAENTPQYDNELTGVEARMTLNYANFDWGLTAGVRFDLYNNSNLPVPTESFNGMGIGRYYIEKATKNITVTAGHFYGQFGNGIVFRAYEERALGIDNAILGVKVKYESDFGVITGFTGKQRFLFSNEDPITGDYDPIIKGLNWEKFQKIGEKFTVTHGASFINRTLDQESMGKIVNVINSKDVEDRYVPKFNVYAGSIYANMSYEAFSLNAEYALKSKDVIVDLTGDIVQRPGNVLYLSGTFAKKGLGISLEYKRTEAFSLRTSANEIQNRGFINFLPPMARSNTYRLTARYNAVTQEWGENAVLGTVNFKLSKNTNGVASVSFIQNLDGDKLFNENYIEVKHKFNKKFKGTFGLQAVTYNRAVYEGKGDSALQTLTPFVDLTYKVTRRKSIRIELQYLNMLSEFEVSSGEFTPSDLGSFAFGLIEFNSAGKFSLSASNMYNAQPSKGGQKNHYPTFSLTVPKGSSRFTLSYIKQVEGVVCTGGVCRFEPAFSGVRLGVTTNF